MRRGQLRRALRDLCYPRRATGQRARGDGDTALTASHHRQARDAQGRPAQLRALRLGPLSVPTIHIGREVEVVAQNGKVMIIFLGEIIATHDLVAPGETSILDEHYGGPRPMPTRAVRPKTRAEKAFCALGPAAESFIKGAAACGMTSLKGDLDELAQMEAAHGKEVLLAALERAASFDRFRAHDVRSIIAAGTGVPRPAAPGEALIVELPLGPRVLSVTTPSVSSREHRPSATTGRHRSGAARLGLPRRAFALSELLVTAKTQRWKPEEFLRTLVEAEIASRDDQASRLKAAAFPVIKTLDEFDVAASSVKQTTFDYLSSLEWVRAKENLCVVGPAGTGKSHLLVALGHGAIDAGFRVRYFSAVELVETLYRGLADNSVGRVLEGILRADLILIDEIGFAHLDHTGAQLFFRLVAGAYERRSLGVASHWPFEDWGHLAERSTAVSLLDRLLHHNVLVVTQGESFRMKEARGGEETRLAETENSPQGWDFSWPKAGTENWPRTFDPAQNVVTRIAQSRHLERRNRPFLRPSVLGSRLRDVNDRHADVGMRMRAPQLPSHPFGENILFGQNGVVFAEHTEAHVGLGHSFVPSTGMPGVGIRPPPAAR